MGGCEGAMKLPREVEKEIQEIEQRLGSLPGMKAGLPRLRALRSAVEEALRVKRVNSNRFRKLLSEPKDSSRIHYDEDTIPHGACSDPVHCDCMCPWCWQQKVMIIQSVLQ